jgi:peptidoglycan/LPS O-acetylase OafA/YrhL
MSTSGWVGTVQFHFRQLNFNAHHPADTGRASHLTLVNDVGRVAYIDGLRGIAALCVVFCHTALLTPMWANVLTSPERVPFPWLAHALVDGSHGVDLFFVLSGFCLAYPALARFHARGHAGFDIVRFATHRIVRILPPYYLASGLFLVLAFGAWLHSGRFATPGTDVFRPYDVLGQLLLLDRSVNLASPPFWTLIVEMRWYLLFPIVLFVFVRAPRAFWTLLCGLVIAYWSTRMHDLDIGVAPAFLLGVLAADLEVREHPIRRYALLLTIVALVLALLIEPWVAMPNADGIDERSFLWQTNPGWHLTAFFAVLAAGRVAWLRGLLSLPLPVFLGAASYSIYLMHYPIVVYASKHLLAYNQLDGFLETVVAAVSGGVLFWALAERHFCGGPVRDRARAAVTPIVAACARWLGLPPTVDPVLPLQVETG